MTRRAWPATRTGARRGVSLVEIAIAMGILAIVAVPASRMWLSMTQANAATERENQALVVAQLVLESRVRVVPYGQQLAGNGHDAYSNLDWTLTLTPVTATLRKAIVVVTAPGEATPVLQLGALSAKEN